MAEVTCAFWQELTAHQQQSVQATFGDIASWEQMPRYRASSIAVGWHDDQPVVVTVVSHERLVIGAATVDVAVVRKYQHAPSVSMHEVLEVLMQQALTLLAEGLGVMLVHGDVQQWSPYGFAPVSYAVTTAWQATLEPASLAPNSYRIGVPTADELLIIRSMQCTASTPGMPQLIDTPHVQQQSWVMCAGSDGQIHAAALLDGGIDGTRVIAAAASHTGAAYDLVMTLLHAHDIASPLQLALPANHIVTQAALQTNARTTIRGSDAQTTVVGVLDLPAMLSALIPAFRQRIRASTYADWVGGARIEISDERAMIMLDCGEVTVIDGSRDAAIRLRSVEVPALAQLMLGYRSVAMLRRLGMLYCDDTELALWQVLFPELQPVIHLS